MVHYSDSFHHTNFLSIFYQVPLPIHMLRCLCTKMLYYFSIVRNPCVAVRKQSQQITIKYKQSQSSTSKYKQSQTITNNHKQSQTITIKYNQVQPSTTKYNQVQTITTKYKQLQTITNKNDYLFMNHFSITIFWSFFL